MSEAVDRERLGKLVGMLGGSGAEPANALAAVDKALAAGGLTWGWLADLVERGELPGGDREAMLKRVVADRLRGGLEVAWAMGNGEAHFVRDVLVLCEGPKLVDTASLQRALKSADTARRRGAR